MKYNASMGLQKCKITKSKVTLFPSFWTGRCLITIPQPKEIWAAPGIKSRMTFQHMLDMCHWNREGRRTKRHLLSARQCIWETSEPEAHSSSSDHKELPLHTSLPSLTHTDSLLPLMEAPGHQQYKIRDFNKSTYEKWLLNQKFITTRFFFKLWGNTRVSISFFLITFIKLFQRRQWQPTPVLLLGKSHGWRSLVGCSPWGH